tara:strand:- start:283 stop:504 length:222 start_codon:yes stop_codon:yes gene_type:complete
MAVSSSLYDSNMGDQTIDISAATRKFQTSIILQQDPNKDGIISFLESVEQEVAPPPAQQSAQTMRPSQPQGGY